MAARAASHRAGRRLRPPAGRAAQACAGPWAPAPRHREASEPGRRRCPWACALQRATCVSQFLAGAGAGARLGQQSHPAQMPVAQAGQAVQGGPAWPASYGTPGIEASGSVMAASPSPPFLPPPAPRPLMGAGWGLFRVVGRAGRRGTASWSPRRAGAGTSPVPVFHRDAFPFTCSASFPRKRGSHRHAPTIVNERSLCLGDAGDILNSLCGVFGSLQCRLCHRSQSSGASRTP